ncbi:MAG TPA: hypothetical protein VF232_10565 [Gaiellaceae bacterium]
MIDRRIEKRPHGGADAGGEGVVFDAALGHGDARACMRAGPISTLAQTA